MLGLGLSLSTSALQRASWIDRLAQMQADFTAGHYALDARRVSDGEILDVSRASVGTALDGAGNVVTFAANAPRITDLGLLTEEASENLVAADLADASLQSTSQTFDGLIIDGSGYGITAEVIAKGTEKGLSYIDVQFSGTNSSGGTVYFVIADTASDAAAEGDDVTLSAWLGLLSGSAPDVRLYMHYRDSGGGLLDSPTSSPAIDASLDRHAFTATAPANTASIINKGIYVRVADGASINATLRVAGLQAEKMAYATSFIPGGGARAADVASIALPTGDLSDGLYGAWKGRLHGETGGYQRILEISSTNAGSHYLALMRSSSTGKPLLVYKDSAHTTLAQIQFDTAWPEDADVSLAFGVADDFFMGIFNGIEGSATPTLYDATGLENLYLGCSRWGGDQSNATVMEVKLYANTPTPELLQELYEGLS